MGTITSRKTKDGGTRYKVVVRLKGTPTQTATFNELRAAKAWLVQTEAAIREERYFKGREAQRKTLADLIDDYIRLELPKREVAEQQKIRNCLGWWRNELGETTLQALTPSMLAEARNKLLRSPSERNRNAKNRTENKTKSPATVARYMAILSQAFTIAVQEWEWLDSNPMRKVKKPSLPQPRARFLSDAERTRLLQACKASSCPLLYPIVVIALSTGARYSEIMHLTWEQVDLARGVARLERTKNKERRTLPLTHHALEVMKEHHELEGYPNTGWVFPRQDGLAPMEIRKHWLAALETAGIIDFRFHDLRHSAASYLAMNGASLAEIAEVLGHKTLQMVKRYAHLSDQHVSKVVESMNRAIFDEPANDNVAVLKHREKARK